MPGIDLVPPRSPDRPAIRVEISDTQGHLRVDPHFLSRLVERTLQGEGVRSAQISLALVDDATIRRLNRLHLEHDWPTDVISFLLSEPDSPELAGELVVSAETAQRAAGGIGVEPAAELALYVVHGLLHLCGYDDRSESEIQRMRRREDEVLRREGFASTVARAADRDRGGLAGERSPCSV